MDSNMLQNQQSNQQPIQQGPEIASLVLGIASTVIALSIFDIRGVFFKMMLAVTCAIIGLILGITSNKNCRNGMATAGIILSCIGLAISMLSMFACSACAIVGCVSLLHQF